MAAQVIIINGGSKGGKLGETIESGMERLVRFGDTNEG